MTNTAIQIGLTRHSISEKLNVRRINDMLSEPTVFLGPSMQANLYTFSAWKDKEYWREITLE